MAAGSLDSHHMTQHRKARERKWAWTDVATGGGGGEEKQMYRMDFPKGGDNKVPSRRVTGEGRDADDDARALLEEARAGHYQGGDIRTHHDGGRTDAQGEEEGKSNMWGVRKVDGSGVADSHRMTQHRKARERKWAWTS